MEKGPASKYFTTINEHPLWEKEIKDSLYKLVDQEKKDMT
jgi:hypothetical protein